MNKMTWRECTDHLRDFNRQFGRNRNAKCVAAVVIDPSSWEEEYPLESRTYIFTNDNKAFGMEWVVIQSLQALRMEWISVFALSTISSIVVVGKLITAIS